MPQCKIHPDQYVQPGKDCNECNKALWEADHKRKKDEAQSSRYKFNRFQPSKKSNDLDKYLDKLQSTWRGIIYPVYQTLGLAGQCWTCSRRFWNIPKGSRTVFNVPHIAHYYAKGDLYPLWCDPENSGVCCYDCNVNLPQNVPKLVFRLLEVWGPVRMEALHEKARMVMDQIHRGQIRKKPDSLWLIGKIQDTRGMVIALPDPLPKINWWQTG